jgi:hypothetical protein
MEKHHAVAEEFIGGNPMNLVVRYIEAIKNELPAQNREDIAKELQSTIEDELEALEGEKGRLSNAQIAAFLEQRGHPVQVASHYWTRRSLVNEHVYPLYKQALVLVCSVYLALGVFLNTDSLQVVRDWENIGKLPNLILEITGSVAFAAFVLTLVFHFFGNEIAAQKWFWRFNAQNLPDVGSQAAYIPRPETISHVVGNLVGLALLSLGSVTFRNVDIRADVSPIATSLEVLRYLLWLDLGLNFLHLAQPYWTRVKLVISVAQGVGAILCLTSILLIPNAIAVSGEVSDVNWLNSLNWTVKITASVFALVVAWNTTAILWRVSRVRLPTV